VKTRVSGQLARMMLQIAALVVPASRRQEWLTEWRGELFQVLQDEEADAFSRISPTCFALGSFLDASWTRKHNFHASLRAERVLSRPGACLAALGVLSAISVLICLSVPNLRHQIVPPPFRGPHDLQVLSLNHSSSDSELQVSGENYLSWSESNNSGLAGSLYYQPDVATLRTRAQSNDLMIAWVDKNPPLFRAETTASAVRFCRQSDTVPLILSYGLWKSRFAGDDHIVGQQVRVAGKRAIIIGIAPEWADDLPGSIAAWGIVTSKTMRAIEGQRFAYGYVLMRTPVPSSRNLNTDHFLTVHAARGFTRRLELLSLSSLASEHRMRPLQTFVSSGEVALLLLPVILIIWPISSGPFLSLRSLDFRSVGFLLLAVASLIPSLYCIPLAIAALGSGGSPDAAIALQALTTCALVLAVIHWGFRDQSQRCPKCLCILSSPARVGESSHSFLAWSGTELMCGEGHGLLQVPDYPTSWNSGARWLSLDISWQHLFQH
jgi:hypothetical protein